MEDISGKIRKRRKMMSLSQEALAEGVSSQSSISRLENGSFTISLGEFLEVMERLNLSMHDVFCSGEKTPGIIVREQLDAARKEQDYDRMEEILESERSGFWKQSPELEGYRSWHHGLVKQSKGQYRMALRMINTAIEMNQKNEWMYEAVAEMHLAKGNIYSQMKYDAIDSYKEAEKYYRHSDQKSFKLIIKILCNLSISYCRKNEYEKALKYSNKGINILQKNESTYLLCETFYNKVMALIALEETKEALEIIHQIEYLYESHQKLDMLENLKTYSVQNI
ncbi:helix-turn-helix domain-containing protein [Salinicoccus roseus]|uniref:helix-turn-helix domain-containing protein n=1 Tax=Salinicoccus roseus TaxID=45670 RepID=UPI001EF69D36|nr:helix-turn-helix domain-containing protein [Salinicoccus roseus]MCG7331225.1 helix-turn-helix domain-containing protein [Salinicoccus roseus]